MRALRGLAADHGATVVCSVHQPGSDVFELVDDLVILAEGGRVVYRGSKDDAKGK